MEFRLLVAKLRKCCWLASISISKVERIYEWQVKDLSAHAANEPERLERFIRLNEGRTKTKEHRYDSHLYW